MIKLLSTVWALTITALIFLGLPVILASVVWVIIQWAWL